MNEDKKDDCGHKKCSKCGRCAVCTCFCKNPKNAWGPEMKMVYEHCLKNVSGQMEVNPNYDIFDGSYQLSVVFDLDKEDTFQDIVKFRQG